MIASILLIALEATVSLYRGPAPEPTAVFKDWITGCDNIRNCSAIALSSAKDGSDAADHLEVLIERPLASTLYPIVSIRVQAGAEKPGALMLFIDDRAIDLPKLEGRLFVFTGPDALALIRKMRAGSWLILREVDNHDFARASLAGLTASLLRIDVQQGRDGTAAALARRGNRVAYDDLPGYQVTLGRSARSDRPPAAPDAGQMALLRSSDTCSADTEQSPAPRIVRLDADNSMMIMPWQCGNGAYNLYSNIMIVKNYGEISSASFDYDNGITGDGPSNVLVNVSWDDEKRVLESFARHRGIGDCGRVDRYIWDGEKFMLSEQLVMPECRMAFDRIRTWKVDVVDR